MGKSWNANFSTDKMKAVPVGKRRRNNPIARDFSFFVQPHPMKCAAARGFDPAQRRACAQLKRFANAAALQRGNGLFHDANRLPRFGKQNSQSRIAVAFLFTWHVELEIFIAQIRLRAAQIADDARCAGNRSEQDHKPSPSVRARCRLLQDDPEKLLETRSRFSSSLSCAKTFCDFSSALRQASSGKSQSNPPSASRPNK